MIQKEKIMTELMVGTINEGGTSLHPEGLPAETRNLKMHENAVRDILKPLVDNYSIFLNSGAEAENPQAREMHIQLMKDLETFPVALPVEFTARHYDALGRAFLEVADYADREVDSQKKYLEMVSTPSIDADPEMAKFSKEFTQTTLNALNEARSHLVSRDNAAYILIAREIRKAIDEKNTDKIKDTSRAAMMQAVSFYQTGQKEKATLWLSMAAGLVQNKRENK